MTGIIVVNKAQDFTSFDVVAVMRGICKIKKIGHTGTLDPMATGVLPILIGGATKACDLIPDSDKAYVAKFKLGTKTTTGDIWGEVKDEKNFNITKEELENELENFRGEIFQIPPMYSAVSVNGQRLYKLARQGIEIEREKRAVFISKLELRNFDGSEGELYIKCSKGTYIRTLIEDIAEKFSTYAMMTALERVEACGFSLEDALTLDQLNELGQKGELETVLRDVEKVFEEYPVANVTPAQESRFENGGSLSIQRLKLPRIALKDGDILRVWGSKFLGLGKILGEELMYYKKFQ